MSVAVKMKPMPTRNPKALIEAAAPFARLANSIDGQQYRVEDFESVWLYCEEWPTVGDIRRLRDELVRMGWKP